MVIIDRLTGRKGEIRDILGISSHEGCLDISDDAWGESLSVIQEVTFDHVVLANTDVKVNFEKCFFHEVAFKGVTSESHFWAAGNRWSECLFDSVYLVEMISPMNTFERCRFENVSIVGYRPYQTLFENCVFEGCSVEGLRAQIVSNRGKLNERMVGEKAMVMFRNCQFSCSQFNTSYFAGVEFQRCTFLDTGAFGCDFSGVISDLEWWPLQNTEPFVVFLGKVLELVEGQCGEMSEAAARFKLYFDDYRFGGNRDKDFSKYLYDGSVSDDDLDKIEIELPKLISTFPF